MQEPTANPLGRVLEEAAREVLVTEFEKLGLDFTRLDPTIRAVMERAAISPAQAKAQVESFVRVAALADQYSLTDDQKAYVLVKAYEQHGQRLAKSQDAGPHL
jgi:hypothetical protein